MDIHVWSIPTDEFMGESSPWVEQAMAYLMDAAHRGGEMDEVAVHAKAASGQMAVLVASQGDIVLGAAGVEYTAHPVCTVLTVTLLGGTRIEMWLDKLVTTLDDGCRTMGAARLEITGRPGWARILRPYADELAVVMVREVTPHEGPKDNEDRGKNPGGYAAGLGPGDAGHPERGAAWATTVGPAAPRLHRA